MGKVGGTASVPATYNTIIEKLFTVIFIIGQSLSIMGNECKEVLKKMCPRSPCRSSMPICGLRCTVCILGIEKIDGPQNKLGISSFYMETRLK